MKRAPLLLLISSFFLLVGASHGGSDKKHQNQPTAHHRSGASKPNPTERPFTVIVEPAPVQVVQQTAPVEKKQAAQKWYQRPSATDWGILGVTLAYTLISLGLLDATRRQAKLAKIAAEAAGTNAQAAKEQAEIAQQTLVLTQRPKLMVRNVVITAPRPPGIQGEIPLFQPRYEISGKLYVVNVGGTVATTQECWCWGVPIQGELPMEPPYEGGMGYPLTQKLKPGESMPITFRNLKEIGNEGPLIRQGSDNWAFYVMGWIAYADDLGLVRRTAFCRKWDARKKRLPPIDDPDYEQAE